LNIFTIFLITFLPENGPANVLDLPIYISAFSFTLSGTISKSFCWLMKTFYSIGC